MASNTNTSKTKNVIALVGKGGVGKTTLAAIIINRLIAHQCRPILVVDADPNTGLDNQLGIKIKSTIGTIREETKDSVQQGLVVNITKQQLLEIKIAESLVEAQDFDFIAMGRPEGPGCYCYANNILRSAVAKLSAQYPYVVIDNEAGLENLSRRLNKSVNLMIIVSDPSNQGLRTVERIYQLAQDMGIHYDQLALCVNRLHTETLSDEILDLQKRINADYLVGLEEDPEILERGEQGLNLLELAQENPTVQKIEAFLTEANQFEFSSN